MRSITLAVVVALGLLGALDAVQAAAITYTGADGGNWTDGGNWSGGAAPAANDTVQINSGDTVFLNTEWPANPLDVDVDGTIDQQSAMRLWNVRVNVSATGELDGTGGGWLVLWGGGAEFNFESGATLTQDSGRIQFGNSGNFDQTLSFNLAASGFQTISANLLHFDVVSNQTIEADMADYTGGGGTIVLMDLTGNNGMTASIFTNDLNPQVVNAGAYAGSYLQWNEGTSAIELVIPGGGAHEWDGGGSDDNWNTAANWNYDTVPGASDDVVIGSSYTVTSAQSEFATLSIGASSTVTFGEDLSGGVVTNAGTMDRAGVFRLNGAQVHLTGTGSLGSNITFLDLNGGDLSFEDGASFGNAGMSFEHKGSNQFDFELSASGFTTLAPGALFLSSNISNATYVVDMANYTGPVTTIDLMDFSSGGSLTDAQFQTATLTVLNAGSYAGTTLQWDDTNDKVQLVVVGPGFEWDAGGSDDNWNTAANWNYDQVPGASDDVTIGSSYTVTNAQNEFATLTIGAGSTVTFGEELSGGVVTNAGTINYAGVFRLNGAQVHLTGTGSLGASITFLDLTSGDLSFEDGASFGNAGMSFEHKGSNQFDFELSASGFTTVSAGGLFLSSNISNATYVVDMASYTGPVGTIDLLDFSSGGTLTDAQFQAATLTVLNAGSYAGSYLQWDDPADKVQLVVLGGPYTWDAGGSDDNWNTAANWNYDDVPGASHDVVIGSSYTVTNAQSEFATLSIGAGSTVTFGEELSGGVVTNAGTMDYAGVFRLNGAQVHLTGTGSLGSNITFLDLNGGDLSFEDGASFGNAGMSFEHKGSNRFDFELSASGFTALAAGALHVSSDIANATYVVDMANYTGSPQIIDLMDFSSGGTLTDAQFQTATLTVLNAGSYAGAALRWDDATDKVQLFMVTGTLFKFR